MSVIAHHSAGRVEWCGISPEAVPPNSSAPNDRRYVQSAQADDDPLAPARIKCLIKRFGRSRLADIIGVRPTHLTRWVAGDATPGPAAAVMLVDFEHIFARARLVWGADAA